MDGKANAAIVPAGKTAQSPSSPAVPPTRLSISMATSWRPDGFNPGVLSDSSRAGWPIRVEQAAFRRPALSASVGRDFPVLAGALRNSGYRSGVCHQHDGGPVSGTLGFLTVWGAGFPQPGSSTLNASTGATTSNMAIVPAGAGGAISVIATDTTHLIIDINGYFAPPGAPGSLDFYTTTPCRIADTRGATGPFGGPTMGARPRGHSQFRRRGAAFRRTRRPIR